MGESKDKVAQKHSVYKNTSAQHDWPPSGATQLCKQHMILPLPPLCHLEAPFTQLPSTPLIT